MDEQDVANLLGQDAFDELRRMRDRQQELLTIGEEKAERFWRDLAPLILAAAEKA